MTPEFTLITSSAHIRLSPQFHREHPSSWRSVLDWRNNEQCVFSPLRINLDGESPNNDFLGGTLLTPIVKWDSNRKKEVQPLVVMNGWDIECEQSSA